MGRSGGSLDDVIGRQLMVCSVLAIVASSSGLFSALMPIVFFREFLTLPTRRSYHPPYFGERGGMNDHVGAQGP